MRTGLLRGEGATITCPLCREQHRSVARIEGVPVLPCPLVHTGDLKLHLQPPSKGGYPVAYCVGPTPEPIVAEPETVETTEASAESAPPTPEKSRQRRVA